MHVKRNIPSKTYYKNKRAHHMRGVECNRKSLMACKWAYQMMEIVVIRHFGTCLLSNIFIAESLACHLCYFYNPTTWVCWPNLYMYLDWISSLGLYMYRNKNSNPEYMYYYVCVLLCIIIMYYYVLCTLLYMYWQFVFPKFN